MSHLSLLENSGNLYFKYENVGARKRIHYSCEDVIEKSVHHYYILPSPGKPCDATW